MMFFSKFTPKRALRHQAEKIYAQIVDRSRDVVFYQRFKVSDTIDGRFDALVLHVFLIARGLLEQGERANKLVALLLESFVTDMDRSMRELGVGDLSVGKKVKSMMGAYRGRAQAYGDAFGQREEFKAVLIRNLYRGEAPDEVLLLELIERLEKDGEAMIEQAPQILAGDALKWTEQN